MKPFLKDTLEAIKAPVTGAWERWQQRRLEACLAVIASVPEGKQLVDTARKANISFRPSVTQCAFLSMARLQPDGTMTYTPLGIDFPALFTKGVTTRMLIHELRHCQQNVAGLNPGDRILSPDDCILFDRFKEADAEATTIDIAWKLKQAGKPMVWKSCQRSLMMTGAFGRYFKAIVRKNPGAAADGSAKRAVFNVWFYCGPQLGLSVPQRYIEQGLNHWKAGRTEQRAKLGAPFAGLPADYLKRVGNLSDVNYLDPPQGMPDNPAYRDTEAPEPIAKLLRACRGEYDTLKEKFAKAANDAGPAEDKETPRPQSQAHAALAI